MFYFTAWLKYVAVYNGDIYT